jgi:hypothetical protein
MLGPAVPLQFQVSATAKKSTVAALEILQRMGHCTESALTVKLVLIGQSICSLVTLVQTWITLYRGLL